MIWWRVTALHAQRLYALLSSIANVPLKQGIAVTGSMDQNGDVSHIGGVNEKIEGFFELCRLREGLTESHGDHNTEAECKTRDDKKDVVDGVR